MAMVAPEPRPPDLPFPDALRALAVDEEEVEEVRLVAEDAVGVCVTSGCVDVIVIMVGPCVPPVVAGF